MNRFISKPDQAINRLADCPLPQALTLPMGGRILVLAPHADDETLGCGGTIALLRQRGCTVRVVVVTDGRKGDPHDFCAGEVYTVRRQEVSAATAALGGTELVFMDEPDGGVVANAELIRRLQAEFANFAADWLFIPSLLDYHRDHVATSYAALAAWRRMGQPGRVFFYEIWAPLPANLLVDISAVMSQKKAAIDCYVLPLRYCDYRSANLGLAAYRGLYCPPAESQRFAECFTEVHPARWPFGLDHLLLHLRMRLERRLHSA
ncbi:PIG-L deacetylase family protein [Parachitinimonas caeni]|uniref:PIG-L family deacetylase n=1 Tax=Parachitinimonas caeni TaxID=3031301 RepID=A0ABT7DS50_9NEIS|nr:PIG-L deacetylase family protein [Parachitinimonas caeni]MDK2122789.1 PIG-L family deacetylase [Parachitinimonas caeni]